MTLLSSTVTRYDASFAEYKDLTKQLEKLGIVCVCSSNTRFFKYTVYFYTKEQHSHLRTRNDSRRAIVTFKINGGHGDCTSAHYYEQLNSKILHFLSTHKF